MKIIFYSNSDNKLAKLIAYQYLDYVDLKSLVAKIEEVFLIKSNTPKDNLTVVGKTDENNKILAVGCYGQENIIMNLINGLNNMFGIQEEILLVDISLISNLFIRLGIFAGKLNLKSLGGLLLKKGIASEITEINKIIDQTKERVSENK
ncbi:MAG: DUF3189 family protein [Bacillota bacterium]